MDRPTPADDALIIRLTPSGALRMEEVAEIRGLLDRAFGSAPDDRFEEADWQHALGGLHVVAELAGRLVGHASVVPRTLWLGDRPTRTGYVEAVATEPSFQRRGVGTAVMREVGRHIEAAYDLGALGTGEHGFYERLGWRTWQGPSFVRAPDGERRTRDEDGYILVLETRTTPQPLRLDASIACDWREGDVW